MASFPKNRFPAIFDAHLEFLRKMQKKNKKKKTTHLSTKPCILG